MSATAHRYIIRDGSAHSTLVEVETYYTPEEMVAALQSNDLDCGFVGEFLAAIAGISDPYCDQSDFVSFQHDVLVLSCEYYDSCDRYRQMEIRVLPVVE